MRRVGLLLVDGVLIALATIFALLLRDNFEFSWTRLAALLPYLALTLTAAAAIFPLFGISRTIWRLAVMNDHLRLFGAIVLTVVAAVTLCFVHNRLENVARALPVLQALLMLVFMVGARVVIRVRYLARAKPAQLAMPMQGAGVGESVLVVGLTRLTELYLRSVADFAPERVRIAGLLVRSPHQAGRLVHGHPVLGAPDQVADALRELEEHGVMVDRIVVTTAFDRLLDAERDALLGVERSSGIRLEFIAERLGLEGSDVARPAAGSQSTSERTLRMLIAGERISAAAIRQAWRDLQSAGICGAGEWAAAPRSSLAGPGTERIA